MIDESYLDARLAEIRERTDRKVEVAAAKTETNFAQVMGKLDILVSNLGDLKSEVGRLDTKIDTVDGHARTAKTAIIATVIGTGLAVAALAWAGVQIFQSGLGLSAGAFEAGMAAQAQSEGGVDEPS